MNTKSASCLFLVAFMYFNPERRGRQKALLPRYNGQINLLSTQNIKQPHPVLTTGQNILLSRQAVQQLHLRPNILLFDLGEAIISLNSLTLCQDGATLWASATGTMFNSLIAIFQASASIERKH